LAFSVATNLSTLLFDDGVAAASASSQMLLSAAAPAAVGVGGVGGGEGILHDYSALSHFIRYF
jgi:hypothetical protein